MAYQAPGLKLVADATNAHLSSGQKPQPGALLVYSGSAL